MLLIVNSNNKDSNSLSNSNFSVTLQNQISGFTSVRLKEVGLTYMPYNVSADLSNNFIKNFSDILSFILGLGNFFDTNEY